MNNRTTQLEQAKRLLSQGVSDESKLVLLTQFPELKEFYKTKERH